VVINCLGILLPAFTAGAQVTTRNEGGKDLSQKPAVRVWAIDTTHVDEKTLSEALNTATRIFRNAGVRLLWLQCPAPIVQPGDSERCSSVDESTLILRIVPRPAGDSVDRDALGFAVAVRGNATYATVFRERVLAALDPTGPCTEGVLLGHAIAHELGHLLLGTSSHARAGLMAGRWHARDLEYAASGWLQFSPAESATLRAEAIRRLRQGHAGGKISNRWEQAGIEIQWQRNWPSTDLQSAAQGRLRFTAEESQRMRDEVLSRSPRPSKTVLQNKSEFSNGSAVSASTSSVEATALQIQIYGNADLEPQTLREFVTWTERILVSSGMSVQVTPCSGREAASCRNQMGSRNTLIVRIVAGDAKTTKGVSQAALGESFADNNGGILAMVFMRRVKDKAASIGMPYAVLLAHAAAHEVGHLLLGAKAHTSAGLMKAYWNRNDYQAMIQNQCRFTPEQAHMLADRYGTPTTHADDPDLHLHNLTPTSSEALDGAQNAARVLAPTALQRVPDLSIEKSVGAVQGAASEPSSPTEKPGVKLVVRLYDYAEVPRRTLRGAEQKTVSVFQMAGIKLSWVECGLSETDKKRFLDCEHVVDLLHLSVNIIPKLMAAGLTRPDTFGTSFVKHAVIFQPCVKQIAADEGFSNDVILGYVIAHELGHLLLGRNSHGSGIMTSRFGRKQFERATHGQLVFTLQQAEQMRARILEGC
jgi:hypothetical protein